MKAILVYICTFIIFVSSFANACTGVRLIAKNNDPIFGRTIEWSPFDIHASLKVFPKNYQFTGLTPEGVQGISWQSKYRFMAVVPTVIAGEPVLDGLNNQGLQVAVHYHPRYAKYLKYQKSQAKNTLSALDLAPFILSNYKNIDEIKKNLPKKQVVGLYVEAIKQEAPLHWMVTDIKGKSIVIEYIDGELKIFDNPVGAFTNAPSFDWHLTNLGNYVNVQIDNRNPVKLKGGYTIYPLGSGSNALGIPGDFTPPSRFIRAATWIQNAREFPDGKEGIYELFRILDNFNVPKDSADKGDKNLRSATIVTTGWDLKAKTFYYHTHNNRRVRSISFKDIAETDKILTRKLDIKPEQDIEYISVN